MPGAQTFEKPERWDLPFSQDLPNPDERRDMTEHDIGRLMSIEPFCHMDPANFPDRLPLRGILANDTRIRRYNNGDVIVRQGDYGNSAFLILNGKARVILETLDPKLVGRQVTKKRTAWESLVSVITRPRMPEVRDTSKYPQGHREREQTQQRGANEVAFVQDVSNVLRVDSDLFNKARSEVMQTGQVFGELAALGRIQRSATVVADGEAVLLEIRWQGLRDLRKFDETLRKHIDDRFRKRGLAATLRAAPLLNKLTEGAVAKVAQAAIFETYGSYDWYGSYQQLRKRDEDPLKNEPVIASEGHYPNGLLIIRAGFARLSHRRGNGEQTYSYLGKGQVYGLAELAYNAKNPHKMVPLSSTLRAVGYVDVVHIPTKLFEQMILPHIPADEIPPLPAWSTTSDTPPVADNVPPARGGSAATTSSKQLNPGLTEFLVENRFINGTATMVIDLDRCTRCDDCVRACATGHTNNPRFIRHGVVFDHFMVANACMHCADPVCMIGCPTGAIHRTAEGGVVVINDVTCIGCGTCAASCPYDNIRMVDIRDEDNPDALLVDPRAGKPIAKATKCDLCNEHHGGPACQRACPHDALKRVDMRELEPHLPWLNR
ncbi:MAG: 4Fe-4S dicluster domain-containing protein [Phycisphaera sp.]|nr:4Fe-4S dicluster domain-containing protein [Phycisphaera sp.]